MRLLTAPGPSGQEELAAAVWREEARAFGEVHTDVLGSSWVRVPGTADGPLLAIVGHIDEIALVVTHVGDDGFLAVRQLGGFDPHVLLAQRVEILTRDGRVPGVVGQRKQKRKPGEDRKPIGFDDLYLDIGARDAAEARSLVRPGDTAVVAGAPLELRNDRIASRVARQPDRLVRRARGRTPRRRGGRDAGRRRRARGRPGGGRRLRRRPDDGVRAPARGRDRRRRDVGDRRSRRRSGGRGRAQARRRPALMRGPSMHPRIFELLHETAEQEKIAFSIEVSRGHTNTDADAIYLSRAGVATGVVSIPLRYMHTPVETVQLDDVEAVVRLLVAFARRLEPGTSFSR